MRKTLSVLCAVLLGGMAALADGPDRGTPIANGTRIAFLGDSITQLGNRPDGYVTMVMEALSANGIEAVKIPAGVSGDKAPQMLARLERDVLSRNPDVMTLSCGVNDVWHGKNGVPLETYKALITEIVDKAQAKGIRVYVMTASMIGEDPGNANNKKLIPYNAFLRSLATEKHCPLVDLSGAMWKELAAMRKEFPLATGNLMTSDGVHMAPPGNILMATEILKAFGLTKDQIAKGRAKWDDLVFQGWGVGFITVGAYMKTMDRAFRKGYPVLNYVYYDYARRLREEAEEAAGNGR